MSGTRKPSGSLSGFQVIFERPDEPVPSPPAGEPVFRPRRYHTKSRNGCFNCKKRRIKCSEAYPECSHCLEKGLKCEYPTTRGSPQPGPASVSSPSRQHSLSSQSSTGTESNDLRITAILDENDVPGDALVHQGYQRSDVLDLLNHFVVPTNDPWIGSPYVQSLVQDLLRRDGGNAPYLLYSALAYSAAHLQYLHPTNNKYRIAAPYHYQHSLRQYFEKLNGSLEGDDAESLFAACQLHAFLAFWNATQAHDGSLGIDLGWVRSMRGIRFIIQSPQLMASLQRGDSGAVIGSAGQSWQQICGEEQLDTDTRITLDLQQLQVLESICASLNPHVRATCLQAIRMLRDLAQVRPEPPAIGTFMAWIYRLPSPFIDLLEVAESVALLAMGIWCALFSRIDEWWIIDPARRECQKVCDHVDGLRDSRYDTVVAHLRSFS